MSVMALELLQTSNTDPSTHSPPTCAHYYPSHSLTSLSSVFLLWWHAPWALSGWLWECCEWPVTDPGTQQAGVWPFLFSSGNAPATPIPSSSFQGPMRVYKTWPPVHPIVLLSVALSLLLFWSQHIGLPAAPCTCQACSNLGTLHLLSVLPGTLFWVQQCDSPLASFCSNIALPLRNLHGHCNPLYPCCPLFFSTLFFFLDEIFISYSLMNPQHLDPICAHYIKINSTCTLNILVRNFFDLLESWGLQIGSDVFIITWSLRSFYYLH